MEEALAVTGQEEIEHREEGEDVEGLAAHEVSGAARAPLHGLEHLDVSVEVGVDLGSDDLAAVNDALSLLDDACGAGDVEISLAAELGVGQRVEHDIRDDAYVEGLDDVGAQGSGGVVGYAHAVEGVDALEGLHRRAERGGVEGLHGVLAVWLLDGDPYLRGRARGHRVIERGVGDAG